MVLLSIENRPDWPKKRDFYDRALGGIAVNEYADLEPGYYLCVGRCRGSVPPRDRQTSLDPIGGSGE